LKKRKNFLIYPKFQLSLIAGNTLIISAAFFIILAFANQTHGEILQSAIDAKVSIKHPFFKFSNFQFNEYKNSLYLGMSLVLVISNIITLAITHKIAGPLVRLRNELNTVSQTGKIATLKFRKKDLFIDIADKYNAAMSKVSRKDRSDDNAA